VYYYEQMENTKKNAYTMLVDQTSGTPVAFTFIGYDNLFGSHYDEYVIEYDSIKTSFDPSVFNIYQSKYTNHLSSSCKT